jgi:hypothetical protein
VNNILGITTVAMATFAALQILRDSLVTPVIITVAVAAIVFGVVKK